MIDFNYTAPELLPLRIQEVLDMPNEPHRIGSVVYVPEGGRECYVVNETWNDYGGMERDTYDFELSCGHSFEWLELEPPKHCPDCGKEIRR